MVGRRDKFLQLVKIRCQYEKIITIFILLLCSTLILDAQDFKGYWQGNLLAGTLTRPEGKGPFKAVVMVNGSGSQDRDETLRKQLLETLAANHIESPQANKVIEQFTEPWMYCFLKLDPRPYLEKVTVPMLVPNGTRDIQIISSINLPVIREIAKGKSNFTIIEPEGLNHLFQHCQTGLPSEYYSIEETIADEILKLITNWIQKFNF